MFWTSKAKAQRPDITQLTADTVRLEHLKYFPKMTGWFDPILLWKLLLRVIVSDVFGQYADRRLIHAALDKDTPAESFSRTDVSGEIRKDDGSVWADYVADLGDGFDATYAVAYVLAQPNLDVGDGILPRAGVLFLGGDEVYPTADRDTYITNLRKPYEFAWPSTNDKEHPPVFALPGNHDWYDGLVVFLAMFCRSKPMKLGNWTTRQRRSYFSAKLTDKWWVWGIDIALVRDMDQPQADYFVESVKNIPEGANIILCSAEPGWYVAEDDGDSYRTLEYASSIANNARKELKIPLVLSGDSHHYARYSGAGTQFITSGGGGAFLHGTLELEDKITADWLKHTKAQISLVTTYPTKDESRSMLSGNTSFFGLNKKFSFTLGLIYWLFVFALTSMWRFDVGIIEYLILLGGFFGYSYYQDQKHPVKTLVATSLHAAAHFAVILAIAFAAHSLEGFFYPHWFVWALLLAICIIPLARWIAGTIFGLNLWATCRLLNQNHNDAFSSMQLYSHRNFLRMRIVGDELTVYPIGIDAIPARDGWRVNPHRDRDKSPSVFEPIASLAPHLIEKPITISGVDAPSTDDIKSRPEATPTA